MLREVYVYLVVEGVMLWGFWELFMSRDNLYFVNVEGDLNEAGKRYFEFKKEWLIYFYGYIDD